MRDLLHWCLIIFFAIYLIDLMVDKAIKRELENDKLKQELKINDVIIDNIKK